MRENVSTIYISGPMRGIPEFNFSEFDRAKARLSGWGFDVISPADMDRVDPITPEQMDKAIDRDILAIRALRPGLDKVCLLSGWDNSTGAKAEAALATWRGVECVLPEIWDREDGLKRMATISSVTMTPGPTPVALPLAAPAPIAPPVAQADGASEPLDNQIYFSTLEAPEKFDETAPLIRTFATGATRNLDEDKHDYEAFLSHRVLRRYAEYMHSHRKQADGSLRDGDNWQKGIPFESYAKSGWRHFMDFWELHREELEDVRRTSDEEEPGEMWDAQTLREPEKMEEILCALLFNISGYLHELIKKQE